MVWQDCEITTPQVGRLRKSVHREGIEKEPGQPEVVSNVMAKASCFPAFWRSERADSARKEALFVARCLFCADDTPTSNL